MERIPKFGGLDVALRVDSTAFFGVKLEEGVFEEIGNRVWAHVHPAVIRDDLLDIQRVEKFYNIGYDRLGTGEVIKMFPKELPMVPVISSMQKKQDILGLLRGLFGAKKLIIHSDTLYKEMLEQETYKTDAGNILYRHPSGFHDDRFWACGYALDVATKYLIGLPRFIATSIPRKRSIDDEMEALMKDI